MSYDQTDPRLQPAVVAAATAAAAAAAASNIDTLSRRPPSDESGHPGAKRARVDPNQFGTGQPDEYGNHPDGSWTCPSCGNVNWPRRTNCNRCGRPKVEGATGPVADGTPPGSWVCPVCNNLNWPRRTNCNRCGASKGLVMGGMGGPPGLPPMGAPPPMGGPPGGHPEGSWVCPTCNNVNWPKRTVCNKNGCDTKRPDLVGGNIGTIPGGNPIGGRMMGVHLQTQIQALQMLAMQDPTNASVYLAQLQQLQSAGTNAGPVGGPSGGAGAGLISRNGITHPPGSWECPTPGCDNINWPKRTVCNRKGCDTPRPANVGIPASQEIGGAAASASSSGYPPVGGYGGGSYDVSYTGAGVTQPLDVSYAGAGVGAGSLAVGPPPVQSRQNHPAGSWVCPDPACGNVNWPMRTVCNRRGCDIPRPPQ